MDSIVNALPPLVAPASLLEKLVREAPTASTTMAVPEEAAIYEERQSKSEKIRREVPIERRLEQINRLTKHLSFLYHKSTDRVQIRVADGSGKLVREMPSDEFLRTMEQLHGNAGAILDDKA